MTQVSAILLNWKRPVNLVKVIDSIKKQNVEIDIWLWNNNPEDLTKYDVKYQFNSPDNFKCWPRWLLGSLVKTQFFFTLDDDLLLKDNSVISDCISKFASIRKSKKSVLNPIIGYKGVLLDSDRDYWKFTHISPSSGDLRVDIVKGRFMFMETSLLNQVSLEESDTVEDIKISSYSDFKVIPAILKNRFEDLPEGDEALFSQPDQRNKRSIATKKYFVKHK